MAKGRSKNGSNWTTVLILGLAVIAGAVAYLRFVQIPKMNQERAEKLAAEKLAWEEEQRLMAEQAELERLAAEALIPAWQKIGASRAPSLANCEWEKWANDDLGIEALISTCNPPGETVLMVEDDNLYEINLGGPEELVGSPVLTADSLRGGVVTAKNGAGLEREIEKLREEGKIVTMSPHNSLQYFWFEQADLGTEMIDNTGNNGEEATDAAKTIGSTIATREKNKWQIEIDENSIQFIAPAILETATGAAIINEGI